MHLASQKLSGVAAFIFANTTLLWGFNSRIYSFLGITLLIAGIEVCIFYLIVQKPEQENYLTILQFWRHEKK
jgi:hypothetical protein